MDYIEREAQNRQQDIDQINKILQEVDPYNLKRILVYALESYENHINSIRMEAKKEWNKFAE